MSQLVELLKRIGMLELLTEILHHPHAHDVFQITIAMMVAALVRKIMQAAHLCTIWNQPLDPHE